MLERSKINRRRPPSNLNIKPNFSGRLNLLEDNRCSDDSSTTSTPVFASVHRPRQAGISAIKRDNIPSQTAPLLSHHSHRPSYHLYQQQRRQQQLQIQVQQQQSETVNGTTTSENGMDEANFASDSAETGYKGAMATAPPSSSSSSSSKIVVNNKFRNLSGSMNESNGVRHHHQLIQQQQQSSSGAEKCTAGGGITSTNSKKTFAVPMPQIGRQISGSVSQANQLQPPPMHLSSPYGTSNAAQMQFNPNAETTARPPPTGGRIPIGQQQNFNQISKTATNLLNDIYEKHLLNQTTFDNVHAAGGGGGGGVGATAAGVNRAMGFASASHSHQHANQLGLVVLGGGSGGAGGSNKLCCGDYNLNNFSSVNMKSHQRSYDSYAVQYQSQQIQPPPANVQFHQQQQQQQQNMKVPSKSIHFLKNIPPTVPPTSGPHLHFHFAGGFVEPTCNKAHQQTTAAAIAAIDALPIATATQGPLNHVYETIAERPPMPPPLPDRCVDAQQQEQQQQQQQQQSHLSNNKANQQLSLSANQSNRGQQRKRQSNSSVGGGVASLANGKTSKNNAGNKKHTSVSGSSDAGVINKRESHANVTATQKKWLHGGDEQSNVEANGGQQIPEDFYYPNNQKQQQQQSYYHQSQVAYKGPACLLLPPPGPPPQQYNKQQRTRADGEHNQKRATAFQQLREHQSHHQHQSPTHFIKAPQCQTQKQQQQQQILSSCPTATVLPSPLVAERDFNTVTTFSSNIREVPLGSVGGRGGTNAKAFAEENPRQIEILNGDGANNKADHSGVLPIVVEEEAADMEASELDDETAAAFPRPPNLNDIDEDGGGIGIAKYPYRNGKIEVMVETAQAMAAAAYYARAAQKLAQGSSSKSRSTEMSNTSSRNGGFCGALQRAPPPMPPGLARRLANKENYGIGKVKVMLRVSDSHTDEEHPHFMAVDKKKRQVTLTDPLAANQMAASTSQERGPMVAAPKMFAFDSLFTTDDQQSDVSASALSEVIPAVLEGSDGCLLTIGYPSSGQSRTMLGAVNSPTELGAIPCAISWLYKGINERRQKSGARFSVRVSALGVSATKPDSTSKDLLAAHATESDDSPGVYLRDDFLGGPTELRAPTAERAALFLDAALAGRSHGGLEPAMIFTLHVYQYSLSRKGGVAGGRSRLHLIDLGGCANRSGGLPLSGIGNILLAILSGQRHPPNKDHPLTPLLKDCLAPLTCHVAIMAHVSHTQTHSDALTTIQLASRIHRMRRRKHRFPIPSAADKAGGPNALGGINGGHQSTGSSAGSGPDPSSSDLSADTVIYMGPSDDATDGEHPPVYLPSLSSGDNRCVMSKALKGSGVEKQQPSLPKHTAMLATVAPSAAAKKGVQKAPQSPIVSSRTGSMKRSHVTGGAGGAGRGSSSPTPAEPQLQQQFFSPVHSLKAMPHSVSTPKIIAGRHSGMLMSCSKGSNVPSPKGSPLRRSGVGVANGVESMNVAAITGASQTVSAGGVGSDLPGSPMRKITEEQWIDGPRISRAKVAEARHLMREVNHVKQCETWIDGPKSQSTKSLTAGNLPVNATQPSGYGFMDSHKKTMIRQWVENQSSQVFQSTSAASSPTHSNQQQQLAQQAQHLRNLTYHLSQYKHKSLDDEQYHGGSQPLHHQLDQQSLRSSQLEMVNPIGVGLTNAISTTNASAPAEIRSGGGGGGGGGGSCGASIAGYRSHQAVATMGSRDEVDLHSERSIACYGVSGGTALLDHQSGGGGSGVGQDCDEDQDSGPSEVPPALPLIDPLGSREVSHESLHRIISRHVSRESLYQSQSQLQQQQQQQSTHHYSQHNVGMSDCGLQVTEEEIARTMGGVHPLAALSHCDMSVVSSFNVGDAFSDCAMGERTRNQFDQLARLREIFTSQLAMAEVTPVFRMGCDVGSVYSEPAYRFNTGPGSVCSEPPYRPPSPRQSLQNSRSPSQGSLPSLNGIMQIAGMEQYASLRHPDGASDPNLPKAEKPLSVDHLEEVTETDEKSMLLSPKRPPGEKLHASGQGIIGNNHITVLPSNNTQSQLPLLPLNTSSEAYDSGHDSSTPRTSKHSGISRRAESGYHSVATARDSDESSFTSALSKDHHNRIIVKKKRQDKSLCNWLMNPFACTYPETEGEVSDF